MNNERSAMLNVTGLWIQKDKSGNTIKDKNGNPMIAGNIGALRILIFKNSRKSQDSHPDYNLVFAQNEPKEKKPEVAAEQAPMDDIGF